MGGMVLVVLSLAFAAIVMGVWSVWFYLRARRDQRDMEIKQRLGLAERTFDDESLASLVRDQAADDIREYLGDRGTHMQETIAQAGMDMTVSDLFVRMVMFGLILGFMGFYLLGWRLLPLGVLGFMAPWILVQRAATKRAAALLDQIPDALEMMGRAMQAGTGLSDAFKLASDEMDEPIKTEFGAVYEQVRFGKDWRDSLGDLIRRNPTLFELRLLASTVILQRETGGNLIETLNRISQLIRQRFVFDAKLKAMTSEARASGLILALMPLGVAGLVFVSNPGYLSPLVDTAFGQVVLVYCVASYFLGIFMMRGMSRVDV